MKDSIIIKTIDDVDLRGRYFAAREAKGAILLGCAMGITQKYYQHLAEFLAENGYDVLTFDFRGTGLSTPNALRGYRIRLLDWAQDLNYALGHLQEAHPRMGIFFIGHSLSSQLFGFAERNRGVRKAIFLASSTGYWKDGTGMAKWKNLFLLSLVMPLSNLIWGYTNAKAFGQGENYPKAPALDWRRWCLDPDYLKPSIDASRNLFRSYDQSITSYCFSDDPIANKATCTKLLELYENASTQLIEKKPSELGRRIGHTGFLSRKFRDNLWKEIVDQLQ